jgi:protein involved in polysaccharide export with SLBB domain
VNKPGEQDLNRPFTIEHLILQAGGIDMFEDGHNKNVAVIRQDGHRVLVPRKDYASFALANGDAVEVPRE